ncbi:MAG: group 1 truncated hemoglobin [Bacteriovoracaceae bacterium]|nr:group 1 truncated hemoglobin [Bacteriovoracaceae bacterium]
MNYSDEELYSLVNKAVKVFYDKVYEDPWMKDVFKVIKQEIIENQQTDFMVAALGGPKRYCGRSPKDAHLHIFVDDEMWDRREKVLEQSLRETLTDEILITKWLRIDEAFRHAIVRNNPSECTKRYASDEIINVPNPFKKVA